MVYVEVGLNISSTIPFTMMDKVFMVVVEVDIVLILAPIPPIIQVILVDTWVLIFVYMREVEIGLITSNFLHITMVDYTLSNQGSANKL